MPIRIAVPNKGSLAEPAAEILKEAARAFRQQPRPAMTLFGSVYKLKRALDNAEGMVTLKALVDGEMQSVRAVLDQASYSAATRAHEAKARVIVTGDLERIRKRWHLSNARLTGFTGEADRPD